MKSDDIFFDKFNSFLWAEKLLKNKRSKKTVKSDERIIN